MPQLLHLPYSPWSEKARWALDHHGVAHERTVYTPFLAEPFIRLTTGSLKERISVPMWIERDERVLRRPKLVLRDSFDIAMRAEALGQGAALGFDDPRTRHFNALSENLLGAGRALAITATEPNIDALREGLPVELPGPLAPLVGPLAKAGAKGLRLKYGIAQETDARHLANMRDILMELRDALGGGDHLLGERLSFADMAMACALQFVSPLENRYIRIGEATRRCWTRPELASEFADMISWRDRFFDQHRKTGSSRAA